MDINYNNLLEKYFAKIITTEEHRQLNDWIAASEENKKVFLAYEKKWLAQQKVKETPVKGRLQHAGQSGMGFLKYMQKTITNQPIWIKGIVGAALIFGVFYGVKQFSADDSHHIISSKSDVKVVTLPDSSKIWLNKNTDISYKGDFQDRELFLDGEAYIEVYDNEKPFILHSNATRIETSNAHFNINSFSRNRELTAYATHGVFTIETEKITGHNKVNIESGDMIEYNRSIEMLQPKACKDINVCAWKTGKLVFENTSMEIICQNIEKYYDKPIKLSHSNINNCEYSGTFSLKTSANKVLKKITNHLNLELQDVDDSFIVVGNGCIMAEPMQQYGF